MKKQANMRRGARWLVAGMVATAFFLNVRAQAQQDMIGPSGAIYTGVTNSSQFSTSFSAQNLFDSDLTGVAIGTQLSGADWADNGASLALGPAYFAFQVDQSYQVGAVYYAQRANHSGNPVDKITSMSIWVSQTTPFNPLSPPTNAPDVVISVTNIDAAVLHRYIFGAPVNGQYFLVKVSQSPTVANSNIGGNEFRLGFVPTQEPPVITQQPANATIYTGATAHFSVSDTGPVQSSYQWLKGATTLTNGGRISGATSAKLKIAAVTGGDAGNYSCVLTNIYGSTNSNPASLTLLPAPTTTEALTVISNGAAAYWQLNEAPGATQAADYVGGYTGTYQSSSVLGIAGPQAPAFPGFDAANTAVGTVAFTIASTVILPPLNLNGTNVTMMAWINPDGSIGAQNPYTGIVYCRDGGTSAGMIYSSDGTKLGYQWNGDRYFFDTGLIIPSNEWSFVAMVVTSSNAVLYCGSSNIVRSAVDTVTEPPQTFNGVTYIGLDTDLGESARTFNGSVDDVAFFDRALSPTEINALYAAGTGASIPLPVQVTTQPSNRTLLQGDPFSLSVQATGTLPFGYQWYKNNVLIPGASNSVYAVSVATTNDTGTYRVTVSNQVNVASSSNATVSVLASLSSMINPPGLLYSNVVESSEYPGGGYGASNLFDTDLTGIAVGAQLAGGDWADDGVANSLAPAYVAFQLDTNYPVATIYYAQRTGLPGNPVDKVTSMSLWVSQTTPFDPLNPPVTAADGFITVPEIDAGVLHRYVLSAPVTGKYFLAKMDQNPTAANSNIGGNELRLGILVTPLTFSRSGGGLTLNWSGGTLYQADDLSGPWIVATGVTSGMPIATTAPKRFYRIQY